MKVKVFPTIIAFGISALLSYALYKICHTDGLELLLAIGGGACLFLPLATCLGVRFEPSRTSVNMAVIGAVYFVAMVISNTLFAFSHFAAYTYIIVNGLLLLFLILTAYFVAKAKQ